MTTRRKSGGVPHPGEVIGEHLLARGAPAQEVVAQRAGMSRPRLSEILNGQRPVTVDSALRLERLLPELSAEELLALQAAWDLAAARREARTRRELEQVEPLAGDVPRGARALVTGHGADEVEFVAELRAAEAGADETVESLEAFLRERGLLAEARQYARSSRLRRQAREVLEPPTVTPAELGERAERRRRERGMRP